MCLVDEENEARKLIKLDPGDRLSRLLEMRQCLFHWIVTHHRTMTAHAFFDVRKRHILSVSRRKMTLLACDPGNRVAAVTEGNRLRRRGGGLFRRQLHVHGVLQGVRRLRDDGAQHQRLRGMLKDG